MRFAAIHKLQPIILVAFTLILPLKGVAQEAQATIKVRIGSKILQPLKDVFKDSYKDLYLPVEVNGKPVGSVLLVDEVREFKFVPQSGTNTIRFGLINTSAPKKGSYLDYLPGSSSSIFSMGISVARGLTSKEKKIDGVTWEFEVKAGRSVDATLDYTDTKEFKCTIKPVQEKESPKGDGKGKVKVAFETNVIDKEIFTEPIELIEGVVAEYTLEHSYERVITTTAKAGVEVGGKATTSVGPKLFFGSVELSAELKASVEASLSITLGKRETFTQKITVDGNKTPKAKVVWIHRYRQGTATLEDGRQETFLVCVGVRWKLQKD